MKYGIHFSLIIILLFSFIISILTSATCDLVIGSTQFSSLLGENAIYSKGKIDPAYEQKSPIMHQSSDTNDVDYFYTSEHLIDKTHYQNLSYKIEAVNSTLALPRIELIQLDNVTDSVKSHQIEVIYNCSKSSNGIVLMKMTIIAMNCAPVELYWQKTCKGDQTQHTPVINLGITKGKNEIIAGGVVQNAYKGLFQNNTNQLEFTHIVTKDMLHLFISSGSPGKNFKVNPITITPPYNDVVKTILAGDITKGGIISSFEEKEFYIFFTCEAHKENKRTMNFQLDIPFEDNHIISLYFTKVCPGVSQGFFNGIFRLIYWSIMFGLIGFLCVLLYLHFTTRDINYTNIKEFYMQALLTIKSFVDDKFKKFINTGNTELPQDIDDKTNNTVTQMDNCDEGDILNVKITTDKAEMTKEIRIDDTKEYGGI